MANDFTSRAIIVTGGTGALGNAVVTRLLDGGAQVIVTYKVDRELDVLKDRLSDDQRERLTPFKLDVLDQGAVKKFVEHVVNQFGRIDGLANLVGGFASAPISTMSWDEWQNMIALNLHSAWIVTTAVLPTMRTAAYGRIVAVGSRGAIQAGANAAHYNASKVGLMWLMETISNEVRQENITANSVLPSVIDTPANRRAMPTADFSTWVRPEEVAEVIVFLLSDRASGTSGAKIPVYGKA